MWKHTLFREFMLLQVYQLTGSYFYSVSGYDMLASFTAIISYKWLFDWHLNEFSVYLDPGIISYCSSVQGRMAGGSTGVYEFDSVVRCQHI